MNRVLESLESRRSIRKFKSEQIKDEELNEILKAGTYAPTGMNKQSPILVAVQDKDLINKMSKINAKIMGSSIDPFYGAPTVVVVFANKNVGTYLEDGSLVMGNLLNAAYAVGVGSCWIHRAKETFETEEGKELVRRFGIGDEYVGIGNCILGYADETPQAKARKDGYIKIIK